MVQKRAVKKEKSKGRQRYQFRTGGKRCDFAFSSVRKMNTGKQSAKKIIKN